MEHGLGYVESYWWGGNDAEPQSSTQLGICRHDRGRKLLGLDTSLG